jgi:Flp pilus assembly protein TadD/uncharacterized coiled-coil DUF342 family protein
MKKTLLLCVLFALGTRGATQLWAATDPADQFLEAYFLIQEGDAAERQNDSAKAVAKFNGALEILHQIESATPDWNPHIIQFRIKYCDEHLAGQKPKPAAPTAAAPTPSPAAEPAPPVETAPPATDAERVQQLSAELQRSAQQVRDLQASRDELNSKLQEAIAGRAPAAPGAAPTGPSEERIRQLEANRDELNAKLQEALKKVASMESLAGELQRARDQVRQLEATRDEINAKLQESLSKVAPTQTTPQIEELLKKNTELAAQLAAAQTEAAQLREKAPAVPAGAPAEAGESAELARLRNELTAARAEIERTKQELEQGRQELATVRKDLETVQAENRELRRSYDEIVTQLTDANRKLVAAQATTSKDDEIIRQLRKENALLRLIADRKTVSARPTEDLTGPTIPELKGWRPHRRAVPTAEVAAPKPAPASTTEKSAQGKLVATVTAPPAPRPPAEPEKPAKKTPPKPPQKSASAKVETPPATTPAPAKAATPPAKTPAPASAPNTATPAPAVPATKGSPEVRTLLNEARAAAELKDFDTAATKYNMVLVTEPNNLVAMSNLGVVRYRQGRVDDAEQLLRKSAALAPNDSATRSMLGVIYFRKGRTEEAFSELTRAVTLDPRNAEAHNYLGITLSEKGWATAAEQEVRKAIELNPQYPDAHFNLAVLYVKQKTPRYELARYHYQKALDLGAEPDPQIEAMLKRPAEKTEPPKTEEPKPAAPAPEPQKTEATTPPATP